MFCLFWKTTLPESESQISNWSFGGNFVETFSNLSVRFNSSSVLLLFLDVILDDRPMNDEYPAIYEMEFKVKINFTKNFVKFISRKYNGTIPNPGRYIGALLADFLSVHSQVTTGSGNLLLFAFGIMGDMFSFCRNLM